jgi:ParB family transcriptional regulator, chromosome partitioning protein
MAFQEDSIYWVEVEKIVPNPFQPRREFDEQKLHELADSVRMYGILQPLTVTRNEIQREDGTFYTQYELIAGERRLRASKIAGLNQVPVIIREGDDSEQEKLELAIIENLQREDLNAVDRALAFKQLAEVFVLSHAQVAKKVGRSREYVSNSIRLLALPEYMLRSLRLNELSEGHARTLLMLNDRPEEQDVVFREILLKKLSVREVERIVRKIATDKVRKKNPMDFDTELIEIEKQFMETLGTRVSILKTDFGGKVTIDYFEVRDLEEILARMRQVGATAKTDQSVDLAALTAATPLAAVIAASVPATVPLDERDLSAEFVSVPAPTPTPTPTPSAPAPDLATLIASLVAVEAVQNPPTTIAESDFTDQSNMPEEVAARELLAGLQDYVEEGRFEDLMSASDTELMESTGSDAMMDLPVGADSTSEVTTPFTPESFANYNFTPAVPPAEFASLYAEETVMPEMVPEIDEIMTPASDLYAPAVAPVEVATTNDAPLAIPDAPSLAMLEELQESLEEMNRPLLDLSLDNRPVEPVQPAVPPQDDDSDLYAIRHFSV